MKTIAFLVLSTAAALGSVSAMAADEVTEQIDIAKQAYEAGEYRQAVQELNYATAQIQELLNQQYTKLMPEPLSGWSGEEAQSQSAGMAMMGGGTKVSRRYRKEGSNETVELQVMADSPLLQAMSMMLANPMMMQSDPSTKMYRLGRHRGMIKHRTNSDDWEISLLLAGRILVQSKGVGLSSKEPAEAYLKAMDLKAVEQAFSL